MSDNCRRANGGARYRTWQARAVLNAATQACTDGPVLGQRFPRRAGAAGRHLRGTSRAGSGWRAQPIAVPRALLGHDKSSTRTRLAAGHRVGVR